MGNRQQVDQNMGSLRNVDDPVIVTQDDGDEDDNVQFDKNDKLDPYPYFFDHIKEELKDLESYDVKKDVFDQFEKDRENMHYFSMPNILWGDEKDELMVKVIDFNHENSNIHSADVDEQGGYEKLRKNKTNNLEGQNNDMKLEIRRFNRRLIKEVKLFTNRDLQNRYIPKCHGYFIDDEMRRIYVAYDHFDKTLDMFLRNRLLKSFHNKVRVLKSLIEVMIHLHSKGVVSLDLSPFSIGFSDKGNVFKLLTFGNSVKLDENSSILRESLLDRLSFDFFTAPEIFLNTEIMLRFAWAPDIWSIGVIAMCLFHKNDRFYEDFLGDESKFQSKEQDLYEKNGVFNSNVFFNYFDVTKIENVYMESLISAVLRPDPIDRPNIFEIADMYNNIVDALKLGNEYEIIYHQEEVLCFTKNYDMRTYEILKMKNYHADGDDEDD